MSKPRLSINLVVDTMAHANTIKTAIENQLSGKDKFDLLLVSAWSDMLTGVVRVSTEGRFNSAVDRDAVVDWAKEQAQNDPQVKDWVLSAKLSWHRCTHDDLMILDCTTTEYREFSK